MEIGLLGNTPGYIPVILDALHSSYKSVYTTIHCNQDVQELNLNPYLNSFAYEIKAYGETIDFKNKKLAFGVNGPKAKEIVLNDFKKFGVKRAQFINIIHSKASVSSTVQLNKGLILETLSVIATQTQIGFGVNIKRSVSIGHHVKIHDFVEINPGVVVCSLVEIGRGTIIGAGAIIKDRINIGANSLIGMGSVVTKNIPDNVVAYGNPCRIIKTIE